MVIKIRKAYTGQYYGWSAYGYGGGLSSNEEAKYIFFPYKKSSISGNILRALVYCTGRIDNDWYALNISRNAKLTKVHFTSEEAREALRALFRTDLSDEFE